MNVLHIMASGSTGGIEVLVKNIFENSNNKEIKNFLCVLFSEGNIYEDIKNKNFCTISTAKYKKNILKIVKRIIKYINDNQINVVIVHHGGILCNIVYILIAKKIKKQNKNIKFIRYLHGVFDKGQFGVSKNRLKNFVVKYFMTEAFNISNKLIFISKASEESFKKYFSKYEESKAVIIYNGINKCFFENENANKFNEKNINISFIGRVEEVKGVKILIKAFNKIKYNNCSLYIVGDGTLLPKLKEKNKENKNIYFIGRKDNVIEILDKTDIFVYPSICQEGFGISVVESMSRGCIPITFNVGGIPEIIKDNENGFLVKNINEDDLKDKIEYVINLNKKEKQRISSNAIKDAKEFSIEKTILNINNTILKL